MNHLLDRGRIPKTGNQVSEKTDSEYVNKVISRIISDYYECPTEWKTCFLKGLETWMIKAMKERNVILPD